MEDREKPPFNTEDTKDTEDDLKYVRFRKT